MPLRNVPVDAPRQLNRLVECRPSHVSSRSLTTLDAAASITLLAFDAEESVSEEEYYADTLYYAVEGTAVIVLPGRRVPLNTGDVLMVPAHVLHAVEGDGKPFKILQISA